VAHKAEYKIIQGNNAAALHGELNQMGMSGWQPILMSRTHAPVTPSGSGHVVITVIMEHKLGE
jgi:hypothetical protein